MTGTIKKNLRNGFVFITGEDGNEYITHAHEVGFKTKEGRKVTFEPGENPAQDGKYPWAHNVQRVHFINEQQGNAEWLVLPEELRRTQVKIEWCRCGCCGELSARASNYCPKCGSKMTRTNEIVEIARSVYAEVNDEDGQQE